MFIAWIEIIAGLALLVYGADRFVDGAAQTSRILGIPPLIIGLTIVGIATSMPEILVGSIGALDGKTHIAVGNAIGSNIANVGLVLGGTAAFLPFTFASRTLGREYLVMMAALALGLLVMLDLQLSRIDALILLTGLCSFLVWTVYIARDARLKDPLLKEISDELPAATSAIKSLLILAGGLILLFIGARILVTGAIIVAQAYGLSDLIIGLSIIAVGTSLPELAASVMSIIKKEPDLAIGNILGSNIFNILAVLGIPVLIRPDSFEPYVLSRDFSVMFALSLALGVIIFARRKFERFTGILLLSVFVAYQAWLFMDNTGQTGT